MTTNLIGTRIKALREERKLLAGRARAQFGFKDRQTVSAIETGERHVSAEELLLAVEKLGASLDYFTDPFMLVGEGQFSWRQTNAAASRSTPMSVSRAAGSRPIARLELKLGDRSRCCAEAWAHPSPAVRRRDGRG